MIIDVSTQTKLVLEEIRRTYSSRMEFKLDDLASYNAAKSASNFNSFKNSVKTKIYEVAVPYGIGGYRRK